MCFSVDLIVRVVIFIAFVLLLIAIFNLWAGDALLGFMGPSGPKLLLTLKWIFGFIIFCCVLWFVVDLLMCAWGGGMGMGLPRSRL
jgi:uncharacterized RDD family membrane protein YckC